MGPRAGTTVVESRENMDIEDPGREGWQFIGVDM